MVKNSNCHYYHKDTIACTNFSNLEVQYIWWVIILEYQLGLKKEFFSKERKKVILIGIEPVTLNVVWQM